MNRSIFLPVFRKKRRPVVLGDEEQEDEEQEQSSYEQRKYPGDNLPNGNLLGNEKTRADLLSARKERFKRFQFESTASDDEMEEQIESNLDEIGEAAERLHTLGLAMGDEINRQNVFINELAGKTERLDDKLKVGTHRVRCYSESISIFI